MTTVIGRAKPIHSRNVILTPARVSIMPMPIRFGGVPIGVAIPPTDAPYATMSITAVEYVSLKCLPPSASFIVLISPMAIGSIIAATAVLLIHMEMLAEISPIAKRILNGLFSRDFKESIAKEKRL